LLFAISIKKLMHLQSECWASDTKAASVTSINAEVPVEESSVFKIFWCLLFSGRLLKEFLFPLVSHAGDTEKISR